MKNIVRFRKENIQMKITRDTRMGAEEAIYSRRSLYRIFQAKVSLWDGTLERPFGMAP